MSLLCYRVQFQSLSAEQQTKLIEQIDTVAFTGFSIASNFCSGEFFLESEKDLKFIDFPEGCILEKL